MKEARRRRRSRKGAENGPEGKPEGCNESEAFPLLRNVAEKVDVSVQGERRQVREKSADKCASVQKAYDALGL